MRLRLLVALCLLGLSAPAGAQAATEPGINISLPFTQAQLVRVQESGAKTARFFMFSHRNNPSEFDESVDQLAKIGVRPVFVVVGDAANPPTTPAKIEAYTDFLRSAVKRFRGRAAGWEIWNEQDAPKWWVGMSGFEDEANQRDASQYVPLLRAAYATVKSEDPTAPVVVGGLTGNDYKFLASIYAHGGKGAFDAVATHTDTACANGSPYGYYRDSPGGPISQWAFLGYRSVRDVMLANDDPKPIWITEMGWSSHTDPCASGKWAGQKPAGVPEAQQAEFTAQALHCLEQDPYVEKTLLYKLVEDHGDPMELKYGALRPDLTPKPVWFTWSQYARTGDSRPADEMCGDFAPPAVTIHQPTDGAVFGGALPIKAAASDPSGVPRISLFFDDGQEIRNFTDKDAPKSLDGGLEWQGAKKLSPGPHKITVQATDPMGNVSDRTVTVTKVDGNKMPTVKTKVTLKLKGKGAGRKLQVYVKPAAKNLGKLTGKINVFFAKRKGGRWKTAHKYAANARGHATVPKTFKVKLVRARWRVTVAYTGSPGYARATSALTFKVR